MGNNDVSERARGRVHVGPDGRDQCAMNYQFYYLTKEVRGGQLELKI